MGVFVGVFGAGGGGFALVGDLGGSCDRHR